MNYSLNIALLFLVWNCCFSQTTKKEQELVLDTYSNSFYFSSNSSDYSNMQSIEKAIDILVKRNVKQIQLTGHCSDEELKTHPRVSLERATKIKNLMQRLGYDPNSIGIKDVKNTQPIDWTGNHRENQRVELIILKA